VASADDVDAVFGVHHGAHIAVAHGVLGEGAQHIPLGDCPRQRLQMRGMAGDLATHARKEFELQRVDALLRAQQNRLLLLEFGRDEAFGVRQRLLADVVGGHFVQVRLGDLQVVAEDGVVADFEAGDARALSLFGFQLGDPLLAVGAHLAQAV
jgi:hypothetical protein